MTSSKLYRCIFMLYLIHINSTHSTFNYSDSRVPCCLWGKFAEILYEGCSKDEEGKPICLIRFAKIGRYKGILFFFLILL